MIGPSAASTGSYSVSKVAPTASVTILGGVTLHDFDLVQKAEVIVEHFRRHVAKKIGGRAKAMVVTSSRKHAVRMTRALRSYVDEHGCGSLGILVAFSGTVEDGGIQYSEPQMNGFPESQTQREFGEGEWRFLVVADKYQTGFDQPLLYAMYVDKVLTGLAAVQTLSRLNRRAARWSRWTSRASTPPSAPHQPVSFSLDGDTELGDETPLRTVIVRICSLTG